MNRSLELTPTPRRLSAASSVLLATAIAAGTLTAYFACDLGADSSAIAKMLITTTCTGAVWMALVLTHRRETIGRRAAGLFLAIGLLVTLICLIRPDPTTSTDVFRYVWDGQVQLKGSSPYAFPADHPALASLRQDWHEHINHPNLISIYPPGAQLGFLAGAVITLADEGTTRGLRLLMTLAAWLGLWIAARGSGRLVLERRARNEAENPTGQGRVVRDQVSLATLALAPVLALEVSGNGHVDALVIPLLAVVFSSRRLWVQAACFGLVVLVKPYLGVLIFAAFPILGGWPKTREAWRQHGSIALGAGLAFVAVGLPYVVMQGSAAYTTGLYLGWWGDVGLVFPWAEPIFGDVGARAMAWVLAFGLSLGTGAWLRLRPWSRPDKALLCGLVFLIFAPSAFPWYGLFLLPLIALGSNRALRVPALAYLALSPLLHTPLLGYADSGRWETPWWANLVVVGVTAALLFWTLRSRNAGKQERE